MQWYSTDVGRASLERQQIQTFNRLRDAPFVIQPEPEGDHVAITYRFRPFADVVVTARICAPSKYPNLEPVFRIDAPTLKPGTPHVVDGSLARSFVGGDVPSGFCEKADAAYLCLFPGHNGSRGDGCWRPDLTLVSAAMLVETFCLSYFGWLGGAGWIYVPAPPASR